MPVDDARAFAVMAKCFASVPEGEWKESTSSDEWSAFLDAVRSLLQCDEPLGARHGSMRIGRDLPLQEFLTEREVSALYAPPTYAEKRAFESQYLVGGLPESAVPVESLYVDWTTDPARGMFAHRKGLYMGDTALYMRDLASSLGLVIPSEFSACPDHLSLELEMLSFLLDEGMADEARAFLIERFAWLTAYRLKLVTLAPQSDFLLAVVDVLLGIRARCAQAHGEGA